MNILIYLTEKYHGKLWDWWGISSNPNLTIEFIQKFPKKPWNWYSISRNMNKLTFENTRIKKKEGYMLLEKERSFHKLQNLYVINQYM